VGLVPLLGRTQSGTISVPVHRKGIVLPQKVTLYGYKFSVYTRIAIMVLREKGVSYTQVETNPFDPKDFGKNPHPFNRVSMLTHGDFAVYETRAITHYINTAFDGPALCPTAPGAIAQMEQVISIIDNYAYWPLVRQVFSQRVFSPTENELPDEADIAAGLISAQPALQQLESICQQGQVLNGAITLADCHLLPILAYFCAAPEGKSALKHFPNLSNWHTILSTHQRYQHAQFDANPA
jgi:glutathione S-transferase